VQDIPAVYAGPDVTFCNQPIESQLVDFSPGLFEGGEGYFTGIGAASGAVSSTGVVDPSVTGIGTFEVVYTFTSDATLCTHTDTLLFHVNEPLVAIAGLDTIVCINGPMLQLENFFPTEFITWEGIGNEANNALIDNQIGLINPQLLSAGSYDYTIEYGSGTCYSFDILEVYINALPVITFEEENEFCGNLYIQELTDVMPSGGYWFGDNVVDPDLGLYQTNQPADTYTINYTYTDPSTMCADTASHDVIIHPVPEAIFSGSSLGCNNYIYPFVQLSEGATTAYWEFGDGESSNEWAPDYIYSDIGDYVVTMYASNAFSCTDTLDIDVEVTEPPVSIFTLAEDTGCAPFETEITNDSYSPYSDFEWDVNGQIYTDTVPPIQVFLQGDSVVNYDIILTVSNLCGEDVSIQELTVYPQPQMSFMILADAGCSPFTADLLFTGVGLPDDLYWDYGNGQTSTGDSPLSPTYIVDELTTVFNITVTGENICGEDSFSLPVTIQPNTIQAFFSVNSTSGCPPLELNVSDLSLSTTGVTFDFGDGNFSSDPFATNIYSDPGEYLLTQYVTNGCSYGTATVAISVHPAPEFNLTADALTYCEGDVATFSIDISNPGSIEWDFADGNSDSGLTVTNVYENSGYYDVDATVLSNLFGCVATETVGIEIFPTPELDISSSTLSGCSPLAVDFTNASLDTDFWIWDFDDGTPSSIISDPTHVFVNTTGSQLTHVIDITASTINGCFAEATITVNVFPEPISSFEIGDELLCGLPAFASVTNNSIDADSYEWSLNNDLVGNIFEPVFEVNNYGSQELSLLVYNSFGCEAEEIQYFDVNEYPELSLLYTPSAGCEPLQVAFNNTSIGAAQTHITIANSDWLIYDGPLPNYPLIIEHPGNFLISMTAISLAGCESELEAGLIEVWPLPIANFQTIPLIGLPDDPFTSNLINTGITFQNTSVGYISSYWNFGDGGQSDLESPSHDFMIAGMYPVTLVVTSDQGCISSHLEVVMITADLEIYVPNAFTPPYKDFGSNGINDAFRAEFSDLSLVKSYNLRIYNRWGVLIWETTDPEEYWLGEVGANGEYYSQNDVYVWQIEVRSDLWGDIAKKLLGHVTIIR
jgi:PKD repeat protein